MSLERTTFVGKGTLLNNFCQSPLTNCSTDDVSHIVNTFCYPIGSRIFIQSVTLQVSSKTFRDCTMTFMSSGTSVTFRKTYESFLVSFRVVEQRLIRTPRHVCRSLVISHRNLTDQLISVRSHVCVSKTTVSDPLNNQGR